MTMTAKTPAQMSATRALRRDGSVGDIAAQLDDGDDEDDRHEREESDRDGDVAPPPRTGGDVVLVVRIAHRPLSPLRDETRDQRRMLQQQRREQREQVDE